MKTSTSVTLIPLVHMLVRGVQLGEALYERGAQAAPSSSHLLQGRLLEPAECRYAEGRSAAQPGCETICEQ